MIDEEDDPDLKVYEEFDRAEREPHIQFGFNLEDGRQHPTPHCVTFFLDPWKDEALIERIMALSPQIEGLTSYLDLPPSVILEKEPETLEVALELLERHLK
ncbi:MAG: hypothetical protein ACHQ6U_09995 [Thermodesulfobacteriota bacterium]